MKTAGDGLDLLITLALDLSGATVHALLGRPGFATPGAVTVENIENGVVFVSFATGMMAPSSDAEVFVTRGGVRSLVWTRTYPVRRRVAFLGGTTFPTPAGAAVVGLKGDDGAPGLDGVGVPRGGAAGHVLTKTGAGDFEVGWDAPPAGGTVDLSAINARIDGKVGSSVAQAKGGRAIPNMVLISRAAHAALTPPDPNTTYFFED